MALRSFLAVSSRKRRNRKPNRQWFGNRIAEATGTEIVDPLGFTSAKFMAEFVTKTMLIFHSVEYIANQTDAEGVSIHRQNR